MSPDLRALLAVVLTASIAAVAWLASGSARGLVPPGVVGERAARAPRPDPVATTGAPLAQRIDVRTTTAPGADPARAPGPLAASLRVRGRVLDAADRPLASARVWLDDRTTVDQAEPLADGITGDDGRFAFAIGELVAPTCWISVRAPAHAPFDREVELAADRADLGDLRMIEGGRVTGTIVAVDGATLGGVEVRLVPIGPGLRSRARDRAALLAAVAPDASGRVRFDHVLPGAYRAAASGPRHAAAESDPAALVEDRRAVDFGTIEVEPATVLRGVVRGPDRAPVPRAIVRLQPLEPDAKRGPFDARSDAEGRFEIAHVPLRRAVVEASAPGFTSTRTPSFDPGSIGELQIQLGEGAAIVGRVLDAITGAAIERFAVRAVRVGGARQTRVDADLEARTSVGLGGEPSAPRTRGPLRVPPEFPSERAHEAGAFRCDGLDTGIYVVEVAAPGRVFARSEPVELDARAGPVSCVIALREGIRATGSVVTADGARPIEGARVELRTTAATTGRPGPAIDTTITDARGRFVFDRVAAANYELVAHHRDFVDATLAERRLDADVTLPPLTMRAPARLHGTVRDFAPATDLRAQVVASGGPGRLSFAPVDDHGRYELRGLEPGAYVVRAFVGDPHRFLQESAATFATVDGEPRAPDLRIDHGEDRRFDLEITRTLRGSLVGTVRENGAPLALATVALGFIARTTTDAAGRFALPDLPVGPAELSVRGADAGFDGLRQAVDIGPGTTTVDLALRTGTVRGSIGAAAEPSGPLAGTAILFVGAHDAPDSLADHARDGGRFVSMTVRDGRFGAEHVPAGPAVLRVQLRGQPAVDQRIEVPIGGVATPMVIVPTR